MFLLEIVLHVFVIFFCFVLANYVDGSGPISLLISFAFLFFYGVLNAFI
jgi:hypothetical protein